MCQLMLCMSLTVCLLWNTWICWLMKCVICPFTIRELSASTHLSLPGRRPPACRREETQTSAGNSDQCGSCKVKAGKTACQPTRVTGASRISALSSWCTGCVCVCEGVRGFCSAVMHFLKSWNTSERTVYLNSSEVNESKPAPSLVQRRSGF